MGWLLGLPELYFSALGYPAAGPLFAIPAIGVLCLGAGLILGIFARQKKLFFFLIPIAASELLVAVAAALRGHVPETVNSPILIIFIIVQIGLASYLIYCLKGARLAATALGLFAVIYALFASFLAAMEFSDVWI